MILTSIRELPPQADDKELDSDDDDTPLVQIVGVGNTSAFQLPPNPDEGGPIFKWRMKTAASGRACVYDTLKVNDPNDASVIQGVMDAKPHAKVGHSRVPMISVGQVSGFVNGPSLENPEKCAAG